MTPRFYPVVKESRPVDAKVSRLFIFAKAGHCCALNLLFLFLTLSPV